MLSELRLQEIVIIIILIILLTELLSLLELFVTYCVLHREEWNRISTLVCSFPD